MNKIIGQRNNLTILEENVLQWDEVQLSLQKKFGRDIFESWIKKISLNKEYNNYLILSTPTKFVRDWIVSRYADKILDVIKDFKKTINRIEFVTNEEDKNSKNITYHKF